MAGPGVRRTIVVALLVGALAAGCTSPSTPDTAAGWQETADLVDGTARVAAEGWQVVVAGADDGTLVLESADRVSMQDTASQALDPLVSAGVTAGEPVHIDLRDAALPAGGATITRRLDRPVPEFSVAALAYFDEATGAWTAVPTELSADRRTLTATVSHFSFWDDLTYSIGSVLDTRIPEPTCDGNVPAWVPREDVTFLADQNAPVRWCVGSDPKDRSVLVVKLGINRGYGVLALPLAETRWAWSGALGGGVQGLLTGALAGVLSVPDLLGGAMLVPGGTELHLGFTEAAVREADGSPLVRVDASMQYMLAGLTYTALTQQFAEGDRLAAAVAALVTVGHCGSAIGAARDLADAAGKAVTCLVDHDQFVRDGVAAVLGEQGWNTKEAGKAARRVSTTLRQVWVVGFAFGAITAATDAHLGDAAWRLDALPRVLPRTPAPSAPRPSPGPVVVDPDEYWRLNDVCRGTSGPGSDAACAARERMTEQSARNAMDAFLAAWARQDRAGLLAHTAPEAVGYLADSTLANPLDQETPPDCEYSFQAGIFTCYTQVTTGDFGITVRFQHRDHLLWQAVLVGPTDVD